VVKEEGSNQRGRTKWAATQSQASCADYRVRRETQSRASLTKPALEGFDDDRSQSESGGKKKLVVIAGGQIMKPEPELDQSLKATTANAKPRGEKSPTKLQPRPQDSAQSTTGEAEWEGGFDMAKLGLSVGHCTENA